MEVGCSAVPSSWLEAGRPGCLPLRLFMASSTCSLYLRLEPVFPALEAASLHAIHGRAIALARAKNCRRFAAAPLPWPHALALPANARSNIPLRFARCAAARLAHSGTAWRCAARRNARRQQRQTAKAAARRRLSLRVTFISGVLLPFSRNTFSWNGVVGDGRRKSGRYVTVAYSAGVKRYQRRRGASARRSVKECLTTISSRQRSYITPSPASNALHRGPLRVLAAFRVHRAGS